MNFFFCYFLFIYLIYIVFWNFFYVNKYIIYKTICIYIHIILLKFQIKKCPPLKKFLDPPLNAFTLFFFISPSIPEIKASYDPPTKAVMCLLYVVAWRSKLPIRVVKPSKRTSPKTQVFGGLFATHDAVSPKPQG